MGLDDSFQQIGHYSFFLALVRLGQAGAGAPGDVGVNERAAPSAASSCAHRRHVVVLTEAGAKRLAEAECALAAVDNEVLGALDDSQREVLYNLLLQAARGSDVSCPFD